MKTQPSLTEKAAEVSAGVWSAYVSPEEPVRYLLSAPVSMNYKEINVCVQINAPLSLFANSPCD